MVRMLLVGYCTFIRSERRLCREVEMNLAYCWFCRLGLEDRVPDHSTFSVNRHGRFRESDILRTVFEDVVCGCMKLTVAEGRIVVHNHVLPTRRLGSRGFRAWLADPSPTVEVCPCEWAAELGEH